MHEEGSSGYSGTKAIVTLTKDPIVTQIAFYILSGEVIVNTTVSYTDDNGHPISPCEAARIAAPFYNRCGGIVSDTDMEHMQAILERRFQNGLTIPQILARARISILRFLTVSSAVPLGLSWTPRPTYLFRS